MSGEGPIIKYHNQAEDFSTYEEASFPARAMAFFIDAAILGVLQGAFAGLYDFFAARHIDPMDYIFYNYLIWVPIAYIFIPSAYFIPQLKRGGQTIGKRVLRIRVIQEDNSGKLSAGRIFLREIIGKFISAIFFGAGYLVRLFGLDTFHDKIAKTKVISVKVSD